MMLLIVSTTRRVIQLSMRGVLTVPDSRAGGVDRLRGQGRVHVCRGSHFEHGRYPDSQREHRDMGDRL